MVVDSVPLHGIRAVDHIVFHTTEGGGDVHSLARYFRSTPAGLGSSFATEPDGTIGIYVPHLTAKTYHVANHNSQCIGIEQIGYAHLRRSEWLEKGGRLRQIYAGAWLAAWLCDQLDIPAHASGSAAGGRQFVYQQGLTQHMWVPDNDHDDCGSGYPWDVVVPLVKKWVKRGGPTRSTRNFVVNGVR
jgi:hypothetical protein